VLLLNLKNDVKISIGLFVIHSLLLLFENVLLFSHVDVELANGTDWLS